jgi:hypothetical protein
MCNEKMMLERQKNIPGWGVMLLLALVLAGCGEELTSTRLPAGAVRNFLYYLHQEQIENAMAYWAPDFTPADARARTVAASKQLQGYETEYKKADTTHNADGSMDVTLRGRVRPTGGEWQEDRELIRAHIIERGPGWRLTEFTLLCCPGQ